jgi:hypothetical protein
MFLTSPYIFSGVRFRDVSRLWTGAAPQEDEQGNTTAPPQVIAPDNADSPQLDLCRWQLDTRLQRGMKQILEQASYPKMIFGKSVMEILWMREKEGEYAGNIVIDDLVDVDPTLFEINPLGYEPGLYLRKPSKRGTVAYEYTPVDERRFLVITNHMLFDDANGISELEPLRQTEQRREDNEKNWGRANQRSGRGTMIGSYGPSLLGAEAASEREDFQEALQEFDSNNNTVMIKYEENAVEILESDIHADSFRDFSDEEIEQISLVLTGSPTTLKEGKFGNQSMIESSEVRQESNLEKADCADISAAFTQQILKRLCDFNFPKTDVYPKMQIISPNLIAPTTPEEQDTNKEIMGGGETEESNEPKPVPKQEQAEKMSHNIGNWTTLPWDLDVERVKRLQIKKMQEEEPGVPVAVPAGHEEFPSATPTPEPYSNITEYAERYLADNISVREYNDLQPGEGRNIFTVKRLRNYTTDVLPILEAMKAAIAPTLALENEAMAWNVYYKSAVEIFAASGITMDIAIRDDLNISFRQTRQTAFSGGLLLYGQESGAVGVRIRNLDDGHEIRPVHKMWNNKVVALDNIAVLDRVLPPSDFGCLCYAELVYDAAQITAESKLPGVYPGDSYKYYAQ